ncbi:hypothetical protein Gotri_025765 [Gossypium trilobum]|uniref:Uncharacterized protein n=1 Tax=Gossypium trilobum TaxID=34281 RepID=A0A7J9FT26_9ROSI|nr:hypothetical protein [Gossypium trilobum]
MKENCRMKHARGLKTLCQHLRVFSCLKIILHWKTRLLGYGSITRRSQSTSVISMFIEEMSAKHVEQIQTI